MGRREEREYLELLAQNPQAVEGPQTAASSAALRSAEAAAASPEYGTTADGQLDAAINRYLQGQGYHYSVNDDRTYQDYLAQERGNTQRGRENSVESTRMLAGGYEPTYANDVADAVYGDDTAGINYSAAAYRALSQRENELNREHDLGAVQLAGEQAQRDYQRQREAQSDERNYLNYLAARYMSDRQDDIQRGAIAGEIYNTRLGAAAQNLQNSQSTENSRYMYDTQSAQSRAQIAESDYEAARKLEYQMAEDSYNERKAAQKAQESADKATKKELNDIGKAMYVIQDKLARRKEFTATEKAKYDLNGDGQVDNTDLLLFDKRRNELNGTAAAGAGTGKGGSGSSGGEISVQASPTAARVIKESEAALERFMPKGKGHDAKKLITDRINRAGLSEGEAAYVYSWFYDIFAQ